MVGKMGAEVEFMDNRETSELGLTKDEQNQLTKMSLGKIVGNLRTKLKEEEAKSHRLAVKVDSLMKEKETQKEKIDNMKRQTKLAAPIVLG